MTPDGGCRTRPGPARTALGNHRDLGRRAVFGQRIGHGLFDARGAFDEQPVDRLGRQAVADDFHLRLAAHLGQLFQLPLVEHEIILAQDPLDEHFQARVLGEQPLELGAADAFGQVWRPE